MYYEILEQTSTLTDEQFGALIRATIKYDRNGDLPKFDDPLVQISFNFVKIIVDKDKQNYEEICEKRRENVNKRWQKNREKTDTNVYKTYNCIQKHTKHTIVSKPQKTSNPLVLTNNSNITNKNVISSISSTNYFNIYIYSINQYLKEFNNIYYFNQIDNNLIYKYNIYNSEKSINSFLRPIYNSVNLNIKYNGSMNSIITNISNTIYFNQYDIANSQNQKTTSHFEATAPKFEKDQKEKYILELFDKIWVVYPRKVGKEQAKATWTKKFVRLKTQEEVLLKAKRIATLLVAHKKQWANEVNNKGEKGRPKQYIPHFSTWLNDEIPNTEGK